MAAILLGSLGRQYIIKMIDEMDMICLTQIPSITFNSIIILLFEDGKVVEIKSTTGNGAHMSSFLSFSNVWSSLITGF